MYFRCIYIVDTYSIEKRPIWSLLYTTDKGGTNECMSNPPYITHIYTTHIYDGCICLYGGREEIRTLGTYHYVQWFSRPPL